jgi:hypothetical protein
MINYKISTTGHWATLIPFLNQPRVDYPMYARKIKLHCLWQHPELQLFYYLVAGQLTVASKFLLKGMVNCLVMFASIHWNIIKFYYLCPIFIKLSMFAFFLAWALLFFFLSYHQHLSYVLLYYIIDTCLPFTTLTIIQNTATQLPTQIFSSPSLQNTHKPYSSPVIHALFNLLPFIKKPCHLHHCTCFHLTNNSLFLTSHNKYADTALFVYRVICFSRSVTKSDPQNLFVWKSDRIFFFRIFFSSIF